MKKKVRKSENRMRWKKRWKKYKIEKIILGQKWMIENYYDSKKEYLNKKKTLSEIRSNGAFKKKWKQREK